MNQITQLSQKLTDKYDSSLFLGRLCWYSIPDNIQITRSDFVDRLDANGVPFGGNIPDIRAVDVFKRACKNSERIKYVPTDIEKIQICLPDTCTVNHMFRNAGQDKDKVWRSLVREVVDATGHSISHKEVVSFTYSRAEQKFDFTVLVPTQSMLSVEYEIIKDVADYFEGEANRITPYSIREFIRKGLEWELAAIKVRPSGGIYFVNEAMSTTVTALENTINEIGGSFHTLPLLDDGKQRAMLKKAFEDESLDDINEMMAEIADIMKDDKQISEDRYADFRLRYSKLIRKVVDYSDVLDEALETTASYLELADEQITKLWDKVKVTSVLA